MTPACPIGDHIPTTLPTYMQQHGCAQLRACSVPFPCTHPLGFAAAPLTARVPLTEAAGGGSSACTQEGLCFCLLAFLCSPACLALCPFVPYASGAAILIPCPAMGTPRHPHRNATYARVWACLCPCVLTPATGVHFFGSAVMPPHAPPARLRADKRPQVSAQPPAPGTRLRPLPPSSSLPALPEGSPGRPEELTWSRLCARLSARRPASRSALPEPSPRARCALRRRSSALLADISPLGDGRAAFPAPRCGQVRGALSSCGRNGGESRSSGKSRRRRRRGRGAERRRRAEGGGRKAGRKL